MTLVGTQMNLIDYVLIKRSHLCVISFLRSPEEETYKYCTLTACATGAPRRGDLICSD